MEAALNRLFYDEAEGFVGLNMLIKMARALGIPARVVRTWYKNQAINQIYKHRRRGKVKYHPTIGDGRSYQADIIFLPFPEENDGYVGLMTFINTSTRKAYAYPIYGRRTEYLMNAIRQWMAEMNYLGHSVNSITTDNEFLRNKEITRYFASLSIRHFVEMAGDHSKLGIINRFHRTLRELIMKVLEYHSSHHWLYFLERIMENYNSRINRTTGKAPEEMTMEDIVRLN